MKKEIVIVLMLSIAQTQGMDDTEKAVAVGLGLAYVSGCIYYFFVKDPNQILSEKYLQEKALGDSFLHHGMKLEAEKQTELKQLKIFLEQKSSLSPHEKELFDSMKSKAT